MSSRTCTLTRMLPCEIPASSRWRTVGDLTNHLHLRRRRARRSLRRARAAHDERLRTTEATISRPSASSSSDLTTTSSALRAGTSSSASACTARCALSSLTPRPILAHANPHPNPPQAKRIVFVSELHVDPAFRRRGVASTLLRMAGDAGLSPLSPVGEVRRIAIAHARSHAMIRS